MTFAELIDNYKILIPKIQRDYAQGRAKYNKNDEEMTSEKPYQIREGLVKSLYETILNGKSIDLNFVYGKEDSIDNEKVFIPIDGQQRLTTLFLLHWYVYQRSEDLDSLLNLGKHFSYDTRDSTKQFCIKLCSEIIFNDDDDNRIENLVKEENEKDKKAYKLSTKIIDKIWFTSSFLYDPSVRSMLVMLDSIEKKFALSNKELDFNDIKNYLQDTGRCKISFSYLNVRDFDDEDMYIKMNARGKELTNFEIFKARLEEDEALVGVCYESNDPQETKSINKAQFIGKFNNEFTNLFYRIPDIGKQYDTAIFHFVECFLKYDHYAYITTSTKISEDGYDKNISNTEYTGASLFNDYILEPILHGYKKECSELYINELKKKAKLSLKKITNVLNFFEKNRFEEFPQYKNEIPKDKNDCYEEKELFISNKDDAVNIILVRQYALFSFIYMLDCINDFDSKKEAYGEWKRFVFNITYKFTAKDPVSFAKMAGVFEECLITLRQEYEKNNKISSRNVLGVISNYNNIEKIKNMSMDVIRGLFESESKKATLMLDEKTGDKWSEIIRESENYYYDGNVDFIFNSMDKNNKTPDEFERLYKNSKVWLKPNKEPIDEVSFNETLLCMNYENTEFEKMAHLKIYNYDEVWQLYIGKQKNIRLALLNGERGKASGLQEGVKKLLQEYDSKLTPQEYRDNKIKDYDPNNKDYLRNVLIKERLVGKLVNNKAKSIEFSGTIGLWNQSVQDEYIIFAANAYNSQNIELNTFILAMKLVDEGNEPEIKAMSGKQRSKDQRVVKLNNKSVSYDIDKRLFYNCEEKKNFEKHNDDNGMNAALNYLRS